jgi:H/ACA ribonucleoprotein complex subunit 4
MDNKKHTLPSDIKRKRLIKVSAKTNPNYGKAPSERTVKELINNGMINLDKPRGPTSHQIDAWIREILNIKKVGHGGTLDPNATGVLPIGIGDATKTLHVLLSAGKEYVGIIKFHKDIDKKKIKDISKSFVGDVTQMPPVRSAVKRVHRSRQIYYLEILEISGRDVLFQVGCEAGTYVRTLAVDIGKKLKIGAHLAELRRTKVGNLTEKNSVLLQDVKDAFIFWKEDKDEKMLCSTIHPLETLLDHLPKIVIRDSAVDALCHGASLAIPGVVELDSGIKKDEVAAVLSLKGEGVALVNPMLSTEEILEKDTGICASINRVIMKKGTYPSIWKRN